MMNNAAGNNHEIKVFVIVKPIPLFLLLCPLIRRSGENERGFLFIELSRPKLILAALSANARRAC